MINWFRKSFCSHEYSVIFHKETPSPFEELIKKEPNLVLKDIKPWLFAASILVVLKCSKCGHVYNVQH